jgi:Raf kinase inhibitor-like YbhB/YbcL family protein
MVMAFRLTSPTFEEGAAIPRRHTCSGEDLSPPLEWDEPPPGTRGFAILCEDPDAPGGTFRHWAIFDIPLERRRLAEGLRPVATVEGMCQATNDFGRLGYAGPCPPRGHGNHHYHFRLLALDVDRLSVDPQMSCGMVEAEAREHVLAAAELVGLFRR